MKAASTLMLVYLMSAWPTVWAQPTPTALVKTQPLSIHDMTQTLTAYGTVIGQPGQIFNLNLPAAGRVDALLVSPGQRVKKGQPLLRIGTDPTSRLAFTQAESALSFAKRDLERQQVLLAQQLATNAQVDAANHAVRDAEQALATQRALGTSNAVTLLSAPVSGVVTTLALALGDRFAAGATLAQLTASSAMQVRLGLLPEEAPRVQSGMKVHIGAIFDTGNTVNGSIELVAGQIDPISQRVDALVQINAATLFPGTRVKGTITVGQRQAIAVPRQAVLRDDQGAYVFQVVGAKAHRVAVNTAEESQGLIAVTGPLVANSPVVVLGNYELQDGMPVREATP